MPIHRHAERICAFQNSKAGMLCRSFQQELLPGRIGPYPFRHRRSFQGQPGPLSAWIRRIPSPLIFPSLHRLDLGMLPTRQYVYKSATKQLGAQQDGRRDPTRGNKRERPARKRGLASSYAPDWASAVTAGRRRRRQRHQPRGDLCRVWHGRKKSL